MSPFVVNADEDSNRYQATSTLAGTRVRTDLKDIASALTVVTSQFMKDTGATNNLTLLQYTPNTEVSGTYGNFAGVGGTYVEGSSERAQNNPGTNTRVRGLDSADNTRDYFQTDIPWDSFNVGRIDLQRGPNSILFGVGSPAGIINSSVNTAGFADTYKLENRVGSFGTVRGSLDFNHVLLDDQLAVRVALLDDNTKYRQEPAFNHDKRIYAAVRWDPKFLKSDSSFTSLRANFERGDVTANRPHVLPPGDGITQFFDPNAFNRTVVDPYFAWESGIVAALGGGTVTLPGERKNFWVTQVGGRAFLQYEGSTAAVGSSYGPGGVGGTGDPNGFAIGPNGAIDYAIGGFPFATPLGVGGYNYYSIAALKYNPTDPSIQGASSGFYKSLPLTDPTIFDFYNNLLEGSSKKEGQDWNTFNISLEQSLLNNRLGLQIVYDNQEYHDSSVKTYANFLTFDAMANTMERPWPYSTSVTSYNGTGTAGTNPNAGRAQLVSYGNNDGNGNATFSTREAFRVTGFGELRATDFLKESTLSKVLGRHLITGVYSQDTYAREGRSWNRFGLDPSWPVQFGSTNVKLSANTRNLNLFSYLSAPLFAATSASGLNIERLTTDQSPQGPITLRYFDSHWKWSMNPADPGYVDPAAAWSNPALSRVDGNWVTGTPSTQSENPANYVGWTSGTFNVLNADKGDIESLYTGGSKAENITETKALTWQGYLWDDTIVGTFGWRRDTIKTRFARPVESPVTGAFGMDYGLDPLDPEAGIASGDSRSWGIVVHQPKSLRDKLPWGTNISLTYGDGENFRVENRYGLDGEKLPNASGHTRDYGVVINTWNDKLQLKAIWYETTVTNANLTSIGDTGLGGSAYFALYLDGWTTGGALQDLAGIAGASPGFQYFWDWRAHDRGLPPSNPADPAFQNDPITVHEKEVALAWLNNPMPANMVSNFGFPVVNMAAVNSGDWAHSTNSFNPTIDGQWSFSPTKGPATTATVDYASKGVEFEIVGQPTENWNIALNVSKQKSSQTQLGAELVAFLTAQYARYQAPGGDLRLWWAGDQTVRDYYNQNIWAAFQFQQQTNGKLVPEMSPWRVNAVTNYAFDEGILKGVNVGLGYRWQDGVILGYALNAAKDNLDVDRPYWGKSLSAVDLWVGYQRKLTEKLTWEVQLNIHSLGQDAHLRAISVQPDGSHAGRRIVEGQTWTLRNTISF